MLAEAAAALGLIAGSFAATNLDNLALLVSWLLQHRGERRRILVGHLGGMFALLALALAFGLGAAVIPDRHVGYLGLVPIGLGLKALYESLRSGRDHAEAPQPAADSLSLSIATTQVANGTDTVLVMGPLLADSKLGVDALMTAGFVAMSLAWFGLSWQLSHHAGRISLVERYGHWIAPIVLIVVGLYILDNTRTDVVPGF
jgi:cadmium resistance protein CadD (predicted permease)